MDKQNGVIADYLFAHMTSMFGHRWTSAYGDDPRSASAIEWTQALSGLTRDQIDAGFRATLLSSQEWPPSVPQFLERCLGVPPLSIVRKAIKEGEGLSDFAYAVRQELDTFVWRQSNTERAERMLKEAYDRVRLRVMIRERLPAQPVASIAQEHQKIKPATEKHLESCFAEIRANLGLD